MDSIKIKTRDSLAKNTFCMLFSMYIECNADYKLLSKNENINQFNNFMSYVNDQNLINIGRKVRAYSHCMFESVFDNHKEWADIL